MTSESSSSVLHEYRHAAAVVGGCGRGELEVVYQGNGSFPCAGNSTPYVKSKFARNLDGGALALELWIAMFMAALESENSARPVTGADSFTSRTLSSTQSRRVGSCPHPARLNVRAPRYRALSVESVVCPCARTESV